MESVQRVALWEHRNRTLISQVWDEERKQGAVPQLGVQVCVASHV